MEKYTLSISHSSEWSDSNPVHYIIASQYMLSQNMPQWNIDYFELKVLKKWLMQKGHFNPPPVSLKTGNNSPT